MLGIFITGPISLLLGVAIGSVVAMRGLKLKTNLYSLAFASFIVAFSTLAMSLPEPLYLGFVLDGEIRACSDPSDLMPQRIKWWAASNKETKWRQPRPGWENDIRKDSGTVVDVYVYRKRELYEKQSPWNKGRIIATSWKPINASEKYYARLKGNNCSAYKAGDRHIYFPEWETSQVSPPDILPTFLGLFVLEEMPDKYRVIIKE
jgi:hypothetical protein